MATLPAARRLELLTWYPASEHPDADTTVLMNHTEDWRGEPVWPGYHQSEVGAWCHADGMPSSEPAFWSDMPAGAAPQGETSAAENALQVAQQLIAHCVSTGLVITIEQRPLTPLAQGNYETVASVRPAIQR